MNVVAESDNGRCSVTDNKTVIATPDANVVIGVTSEIEHVDINNERTRVDISQMNFDQNIKRIGDDDIERNTLTEGVFDKNTCHNQTDGEVLMIEESNNTYVGESLTESRVHDQEALLAGVGEQSYGNVILIEEGTHISGGTYQIYEEVSLIANSDQTYDAESLVEKDDQVYEKVSLEEESNQINGEASVLKRDNKHFGESLLVDEASMTEASNQDCAKADNQICRNGSSTEESSQTHSETSLSEDGNNICAESSVNKEGTQFVINPTGSEIEASVASDASEIFDIQLIQEAKQTYEEGPLVKHGNQNYEKVYLVEEGDQGHGKEILIEELENIIVPFNNNTDNTEHRQVEDINSSDPGLVLEEGNECDTIPDKSVTADTGCSANTGSGLVHNVCTHTNENERLHVEENYGVDILANIISADHDEIKDRSKIHYADINRNADGYFTVSKGKQRFDPNNVKSHQVLDVGLNDETPDEINNYIDNTDNNNEDKENEDTPNLITNTYTKNENEIIVPEMVEELRSEEIDIFKMLEDEAEDIFNEIGVIDIGNITNSPFLCKSEILITFPRLNSSMGQLLYFVVNHDHLDSTATTLRSETSIHIPFKELGSFLFVSTYLLDARKQWSYLFHASNSNKQWRYYSHAHKESTQLSFAVVEDPNCVKRWETTTYELTDRPCTEVQQESSWVLIDCSDKEIELFHTHESEMSQSINVTSPKSCATQ